MALFAPIIREALRQGVRYAYQGLRTQDKIIDYTYRRTRLYNRGVVRGIKHGLIAGQVVGGTLKLGLPEELTNGIPPEQYVPKTGKLKKTYSRVRRYNRRSNKYCRPQYNRRRRHLYSRR